ncbi:MAG: GTP cyclohydrolase II [Hyphomicrobiaceae bacterium]
MQSNVVTSIEVDIDWAVETVLPIEFHGEEVSLEARAYQGANPQEQAIVLINRGEGVDAKATPTVRVHSGCVTGDIFHSLRCDCYQQLQAGLKRVIESPNGILIYLPYHEGRGIGLVNKIKAYALQDKGHDTVDANVELGEPIDARDYRLAAAILFDLGFPEIKLISNNPAKVESLSAEGITVTEQVSVVIEPGQHNKKYLETKRKRMAHKI